LFLALICGFFRFSQRDIYGKKTCGATLQDKEAPPKRWRLVTQRPAVLGVKKYDIGGKIFYLVAKQESKY